MGTDWRAWHATYDDPTSNQAARLVAVTGLIRAALDDAPTGSISVLSLCAGDGRDLHAAASGHLRAGDLTGLFVELDPTLAAAATANIVGGIRVVAADAGRTEHFLDALPADLLLLCGVFGNVDDADVQRMIAAVPAMCSAGASVVWTRHRRPPDLTLAIRRWFGDAGCVEQDFASAGADGWACGHHRVGVPSDAPLPERLFTFRDEA